MAKKADIKWPSFLSKTETPWLLYANEHDHTFYSLSPTSTCNFKSYSKNIPQLHCKHVCASSYGWFVLQDVVQENLFSLFNLETLQTINLPPLTTTPDTDCGNITCALSSPPDCHDCLLLLCLTEADDLMFFCHPAQPQYSWSSQKLEPECDALTVKQLITVNRYIYGVSREGMLFYVVDEIKSLTLIPLNILLPIIHLRCQCQFKNLMESCGRLYSVYLFMAIGSRARLMDVKIFELDLQKKMWVEVKCLDGRTFLIGLGNNCTWCWGNTKALESSEGIRRNCIYILKRGDVLGTTETFLYNLLDQTCTIIPSCTSFIEISWFLAWVIPPKQQRPATLLAKQEFEESVEKVDVVSNVGACLSKDQKLLHYSETQEGLFSKLPSHLLELIRNCMHLFEYWNFRVSCKTFYAACPVSQRRTFPFFMLLKNDGGLFTIIDPCRLDSRSCSNILPSSIGPFTLEFSKNGWLLYVVGKESIEFLNPFTRVRGVHPPFQPIEILSSLKSIAFSTSPTCPECVTIGIYHYAYFIAFIYLQSGDKDWKTFKTVQRDDIEFCPNSSSPIFLEGAFYYLDVCGFLGVFGLQGGQPTWQVYHSPPTLGNSFYLSCLVKCNKEIYSVFIRNLGKSIQVFRFDDIEKNWIEIDDLGDHILFISRASSFSVMTRDPKLRNRIYLPRLKGNNIVFYSLETRKYHILSHDDASEIGDSMEDLHFTKESYWSCWL